MADDPMRSTFDAGATSSGQAFGNMGDVQSQDALESQWLSLYNERLLLTVQAVNSLYAAFKAKMP